MWCPVDASSISDFIHALHLKSACYGLPHALIALQFLVAQLIQLEPLTRKPLQLHPRHAIGFCSVFPPLLLKYKGGVVVFFVSSPIFVSNNERLYYHLESQAEPDCMHTLSQAKSEGASPTSLLPLKKVLTSVQCHPVGDDICERCLEKNLVCRREPVGQSTSPSPTMTSNVLNTSPDPVQTVAQTPYPTSPHSTHGSSNAGTYDQSQVTVFDASGQPSTGPWTYNQQPNPVPAYSSQISQELPHFNQYQYTAPPQPAPVQQYYPSSSIAAPVYPVFDGMPPVIPQQPSVYPNNTVYYANSRSQAYTRR